MRENHVDTCRQVSKHISMTRTQAVMHLCAEEDNQDLRLGAVQAEPALGSCLCVPARKHAAQE
jgi:hypothetical protein